MIIVDLKLEYNEELYVIKDILGITDTNSDTALVLSIDKAYKAILNWTGWETFNTEYSSALYSLVIAYYNNDTIRRNKAQGNRVITQQSQGSRSVTYGNAIVDIDTNGLTDDVRSSLPRPKVKVV